MVRRGLAISLASFLLAAVVVALWAPAGNGDPCSGCQSVARPWSGPTPEMEGGSAALAEPTVPQVLPADQLHDRLQGPPTAGNAFGGVLVAIAIVVATLLTVVSLRMRLSLRRATVQLGRLFQYGRAHLRVVGWPTSTTTGPMLSGAVDAESHTPALGPFDVSEVMPPVDVDLHHLSDGAT